jgi:hypothetical protein
MAGFNKTNLRVGFEITVFHVILSGQYSVNETLEQRNVLKFWPEFP